MTIKEKRAAFMRKAEIGRQKNETCKKSVLGLQEMIDKGQINILDALWLAWVEGCGYGEAYPQKPSLPSNLDEAAEEYEHNLGYYECMNQWPSVAFKAGAEWMAAQGETHELTVESPVLGPPMICCPVHADNGDKVIVQIRKK